jgi:hypothetical protein
MDPEVIAAFKTYTVRILRDEFVMEVVDERAPSWCGESVKNVCSVPFTLRLLPTSKAHVNAY